MMSYSERDERLKDLAHRRHAVLARVSIVELIGEHTVLRESGEHHRGDCPFCQDKDGMRVTATVGVYYCFGCRKGGDVLSFVSRLEGVGMQGAVESLERRGRKAGV